MYQAYFTYFDEVPKRARHLLLSDEVKVAAQVLELADKQDLGSCAFGREGSTPSLGTKGFSLLP